MLGSGSAGNSALVATDHCKILVDGGLSARQLVLRLKQCGVTPEELDGVLLTHEHGDHVCGLEVLCRKFDVPIYCNALTAEAVRCDSSFEQHRNWRIFATGAEFSICDVTVETFPVPPPRAPMHCKSVKGFAVLRKITKSPPLARSEKAIRRGTTAAANRKPLDHPAISPIPLPSLRLLNA